MNVFFLHFDRFVCLVVTSIRLTFEVREVQTACKVSFDCIRSRVILQCLFWIWRQSFEAIIMLTSGISLKLWLILSGSLIVERNYPSFRPLFFFWSPWLRDVVKLGILRDASFLSSFQTDDLQLWMQTHISNVLIGIWNTSPAQNQARHSLNKPLNISFQIRLKFSPNFFSTSGIANGGTQWHRKPALHPNRQPWKNAKILAEFPEGSLHPSINGWFAHDRRNPPEIVSTLGDQVETMECGTDYCVHRE